MDGNRAGRLKCGSPLGRLVDEGGDTITMANYCTLLCYTWQLQNPAFEFILLSLNFIFFMMETKYTITGKLNMVAGEMSAIELETAFAISMIVLGFVGNVNGVDVTVGETLGLAPESKCPIHAIGHYTWR